MPDTSRLSDSPAQYAAVRANTNARSRQHELLLSATVLHTARSDHTRPCAVGTWPMLATERRPASSLSSNHLTRLLSASLTSLLRPSRAAVGQRLASYSSAALLRAQPPTCCVELAPLSAPGFVAAVARVEFDGRCCLGSSATLAHLLPLCRRARRPSRTSTRRSGRSNSISAASSTRTTDSTKSALALTPRAARGIPPRRPLLCCAFEDRSTDRLRPTTAYLILSCCRLCCATSG